MNNLIAITFSLPIAIAQTYLRTFAPSLGVDVDGTRDKSILAKSGRDLPWFPKLL